MKKCKLTIGIPPLIIIGTLIVIFPIFTFMTLDRINRQRSRNVELLMEKGSALIRAFEAGTYTGMMSRQWTDIAMENLLTQTAALPDIDYLFIVSREGRVILHNQQSGTFATYGQNLDLPSVIKENRIGWRILDRGTEEAPDRKIFEVYKAFAPTNRIRLPRGGRHMMGMGHGFMHSDAVRHARSYEDTVIFVGLGMEVITEAEHSDSQHAVMMAVILALIGFTGFVLVFMVQRYTQARSSLSLIQIFSENLVENLPMGLIATDMNDQVVSVNPVALSILGLAARDGGENAELPPEVRSLLTPVSGEKGVREKEILLRPDSGEERILETLASPLFDKDSVSLGTLLLFRDVTDLRRLKKKMEQNQRLAAIGRLAAGVAHEIRNPLSSLKGYAFLFKEVFEKGSENWDIADTMIKEVDRLNRVVSDLVELARPVALSGHMVDLGEVASDVARQVSFEPGAEHVDIRTQIPTDLPRILGDADRLKQVLLNLSLNAIQAMDGRGRLDIALERDPSVHGVILRVSDTGAGISASDPAEIFEPYFTTKLSGTGLGLAIVNNIVKAHQGRIKAENKPDAGAVFTVYLPVRDI